MKADSTTSPVPFLIGLCSNTFNNLALMKTSVRNRWRCLSSLASCFAVRGFFSFLGRPTFFGSSDERRLRLVRQQKKKKGTCDVVRARLDRETWTGTGRVAGFARHYQRPSAGGGPDPRGLDRRSRPLARTSFRAPPTSPSTATENRLGAIAARRTYYKNPRRRAPHSPASN